MVHITSPLSKVCSKCCVFAVAPGVSSQAAAQFKSKCTLWSAQTLELHGIKLQEPIEAVCWVGLALKRAGFFEDNSPLPPVYTARIGYRGRRGGLGLSLCKVCGACTCFVPVLRCGICSASDEGAWHPTSRQKENRQRIDLYIQENAVAAPAQGTRNALLSFQNRTPLLHRKKQ